MPRVLPFQGVRYNPARVSDIARVTAPPYDMIPPAEQDELTVATRTTWYG